MPNIKSAKKRVLVSQANYERNKAYRSALKTAIKKADAAIEAKSPEAAEAVSPAKDDPEALAAADAVLPAALIPGFSAFPDSDEDPSPMVFPVSARRSTARTRARSSIIPKGFAT